MNSLEKNQLVRGEGIALALAPLLFLSPGCARCRRLFLRRGWRGKESACGDHFLNSFDQDSIHHDGIRKRECMFASGTNPLDFISRSLRNARGHHFPRSRRRRTTLLQPLPFRPCGLLGKPECFFTAFKWSSLKENSDLLAFLAEDFAKDGVTGPLTQP
jgi:hypothetical protein